tara:strand:+ start:739 stop:1299 length:561 start_codon:yes stop_codon:yes gene_type:complete
MEKQKEKMKELQESCAKWDHYNQGDKTCRGVITIKRILIASFIFVALSVVGKFTSGKFWFEDRSRDAAEIAHLKYKLDHRNETLLIVFGIATDQPEKLEESKGAHRWRDEPFEFINWSKPDEMVEFMFRNESFNCLAWVMRQEKWYSCLDIKTYDKMVEFSSKPHQKKLERTVKKSIFAPIYLHKL